MHCCVLFIKYRFMSNEYNMIVINQPILNTTYIYLATSVISNVEFSERRSNFQDKSRLSMS